MINITSNAQIVTALKEENSADSSVLKQIPVICAHCSAGCSLTYEVEDNCNSEAVNDCIYRVTNNCESTALCEAGRLGFDFAHQKEKDGQEFAKAKIAFENAKAIRFNSIITNEEAMILQKLKETRGVKLFNEEARAYQTFMNAYATMSGKSTFGGTLDAIAQSDAVIVIGSRITTDNPGVRYAMAEAIRDNGAKIIYMHPIEDALLQKTVTEFVKYEVGTEEGVMAMLAKTLLESADLDNETRAFFDALDEGYLCAESNVGDEEFARIAKMMADAKYKTLIIGADVINHIRSGNIARLAALIETYTEFSLLVVAPSVNTTGVSLVCDLDKDESMDGIVGYNTYGDYTVGSIGKVDLPLPAFNQQEGTIVTVNHQVLPTNIAVGFGGYELNDIANAIGLIAEKTIEYTAKLPLAKGFKPIAFDNLENSFAPPGKEKKGYTLENVDVMTDGKLDEVADLPEFNGTVVYHCNPLNQFNGYTAMTKQLKRDESLRGSAQFAAAAKINDGDTVEIGISSGVQKRRFVLDEKLKGTIALIPSYDRAYGSMNESYRFEKAKIIRIGS